MTSLIYCLDSDPYQGDGFPSMGISVKKLHDLRRQNLRRITETRTAVDLANVLNVTTGYISQLIGKKPTRNIGETLARRIETTLSLPPGALDREPGEPIEGGLDGDVLRAAVTATNAALECSDIHLSDKAYAEVLRSVYEDYMDGTPTPQQVLLRYIRLAQ